MSCNMDIDLIQGYLDGTLNIAEKVILEEHFKICNSCRKELTELKLLFFELEEMKSLEIEVPPEIYEIRQRVIHEYIDSKVAGKFGIKEFISTQKYVLENAGLFLKFMPRNSYIERGIKKTPILLYKAIKGTFIGGSKLMLMRARA